MSTANQSLHLALALPGSLRCFQLQPIINSSICFSVYNRNFSEMHGRNQGSWQFSDRNLDRLLLPSPSTQPGPRPFPVPAARDVSAQRREGKDSGADHRLRRARSLFPAGLRAAATRTRGHRVPERRGPGCPLVPALSSPGTLARRRAAREERPGGRRRGGEGCRGGGSCSPGTCLC